MCRALNSLNCRCQQTYAQGGFSPHQRDN